MRPTSASVEWIFLATYLVLEILSAACDQASSPRRPHFALFGMFLAIAAVFISIGELIYRGKRERVEFRSRGMRSWFYHPPIPPYTPFGTLPDIYGLVAGISQCICSIVQYVYCLRHANSPLKVSLLPAIFLICSVVSRLSNKRMNASTEEPLLNPAPENDAPANTPSLDNQPPPQLPREQERQLRWRLPRKQERRLQEQEQKQEQERQVREQEQEQLRLQLQQLQEQEEERQLQEQEQVWEQEQERLLLRQRQLQEQEEEQQQRQRRQRQLQEQGQEQLQLRLQEQKWWSGES